MAKRKSYDQELSGGGLASSIIIALRISSCDSTPTTLFSPFVTMSASSPLFLISFKTAIFVDSTGKFAVITPG
jgi:hypothetical protein